MRIISDTKWNICLSILFVEEGARSASTAVYLAKSGRTISAERVKIYQVLIPLKSILESDDHFLKTITLMYEALTLFFTSTYRKITQHFMQELWAKVDLDYLRSLPYPAPLEEQQYVGDRIGDDGSVEFLKFRE